MTIVEFLKRRIAEDEARAQARREAMLNVAERWPTLAEWVSGRQRVSRC